MRNSSKITKNVSRSILRPDGQKVRSPEVIESKIFSISKLATFFENFKLITVTGAVPGHRKFGGHIRKMSLSERHETYEL